MMKKIEVQSFRRRFVTPVATLLGVWLLANVSLTLFAGRPDLFGDSGLYRVLMNILSATRFLILLLGTLIIYPVMFFRGASFKERLVGSYVVPLAYIVWAMVQATTYFPLGQAVYYGFNPVTVGTVFLQLGLIGLAEIGCRWRYRRQYGDPISTVKWPAIAGIIVGMSALYLTLFWDGGVHWFYVYQEFYKFLF